MKKFPILLFLSATLILASCAGSNKTTPSASDAIDAFNGMQKVAEVAKTAESGKPEDVANSVEKIAEYGATLEAKEFEKIEAVDAPTNFPKELIYSKGKITSASDNSPDTSNVSQNIEIKTLDKLADVRDYYKKSLVADGWKIKRQNSASDGGSYEASKDDGSTVNVSLSGNQYSKIVVARVDYSKSVSQ